MSRKKKKEDMNIVAIETSPLEVVGKEKIRVSGHYIDQKLKYEEQLDLFDLLPETREELQRDESSSWENIRIGIAPTPTQDKYINACLNLLHRKSNTRIDAKNIPAEPSKFYRGNLPERQRSLRGLGDKIPALVITPHELYKEFAQSDNYSGETINIVKRTQEELTKKHYLMLYKRKRKDKAGKEYIDRIEEYQPLHRVITYREGLTAEEDKLLDKDPSKLINSKTKWLLLFHPVYIDQLDTKYVLTPPDISKRTETASGGAHKVTEAIISLRDYLLRALSNKNYEIIIDKSKLPEILKLQGYIKSGRKKLITQKLQDSIQAVINLGLATEVKEIYGKNKQPQYQFILNKDF